MTPARLSEIRALANQHKGKGRLINILVELCDELEKTQKLYCLALDAAFNSHRGRAIAIKKLKDLVN